MSGETLDKATVLNLRERNHPSLEYPENIIHHADLRLASFIAREYWETVRRVDMDNSTKRVLKTEPLPLWKDRSREDIQIDIQTFHELLNRGIIK